MQQEFSGTRLEPVWGRTEPKARYIQENAKTLNGGLVYPTTVALATYAILIALRALVAP